MALKQILLGTIVVLSIGISQSHAQSSLSPLQKELLTKIKSKMASHVVDVLCTNPDGAEVSLKLEILKKNIRNVGVEILNKDYYSVTEAGIRYECQKSAF